MNKQEIRTHLVHCNQGEYIGSCKYGDDDCPALKKLQFLTVPRSMLNRFMKEPEK